MARRTTDWHWNELGRREPLGAILTGPQGELAAWDSDRFFAAGRADVARLMAIVAELAPRLARRRALDFGCGVGRVTRSLADHFEEVVGVDVAPSMIVRARELNRDWPACRFEINTTAGLRGVASDRFDLVYSRLVLQHIPPRRVPRYIREFVRVLAPGGLLYFQLPTPVHPNPKAEFLRAKVADTLWKRHLPRWVVALYRRAKWRWLAARAEPQIQMFGLPRRAVLSHLGACGAVVLDVRPDRSHGTHDEGFEYWATKT